MTIHKRRGGGLGWNYAGLAATLILLAAAFAAVAAGVAKLELVPWTLVRLPLAALFFAGVIAAVARRRP